MGKFERREYDYITSFGIIIGLKVGCNF